DLTGKKGPLLPDDLPRFPVRAWLEYITRLPKKVVLDKYREVRATFLDASIASGSDSGALRMSGNYAALYLAWIYLCDFAGIDTAQG
ncbi:hypothetical protein ABTE00_21025, partial [Acinetobacter baumannii]